MYSLVNSPVLGFDLARMAGGHRVAAVLRRTLTLGADDLPVLAAAYRDGDGHDRAWAAAAAAEATQPGLPAALPGPAGQPADLRLLERTPVGSLAGLLGFVRHEVLDWTWRHGDGLSVQGEPAARATAVVCDAVTAGYLAADLAPAERRVLSAPWWHAERALPTAPAPHAGDGSAALLDRVARIDRADADRLVAAAAGQPRLGSAGRWAQAVHAASWAVHLSGRDRTAAAVQLALVDAVHGCALTTSDLAGGCWNALSGAAHALVSADLLDGPNAALLLDPVTAALGPVAGRG